MNINKWTKTGIGSLTLAGMLCASGALANDEPSRVYRWTDNSGKSHYGDHVPPEYAENGHTVLNEHGIEIATVAGRLSDDQLLAARKIAEAEDRARAKRAERELRDKVLLSTYLSVEEIEALRDRRIELLGGQIRLTQRYLDNLREKIVKLEKEAQLYSPYSAQPGAKPIDEKLARELSDTLNSIMLYEQNLSRSMEEQRQVQKKFASDISRFRELQALSQNR